VTAGQASVEEIAQLIAVEAGGFTGGPVEQFEAIGRFTLDSLQQCGMTPSSRVLDVGCGALRLGYWLIRYLGPDCYFGLEPNKRYVEVGVKYAVGPELEAEKRPRFEHNGEFDFSPFGVKFDFAVARSIFSHASPGMIAAAMESFRDNSADGAVMLASYNRVKRADRDDVVDVRQKGEWSWRKYSTRFLQDMARERALKAEDFGEPFNKQIWLKLTKA
jgi:SAM-dependent methyltransferase